MTSSPRTFALVCQEVSRLSPRQGLGALAPETTLIELGYDSLSLVELTIALEERLGIKEFPMQKWADDESALAQRRYSLGSLSSACQAQLDGRTR